MPYQQVFTTVSLSRLAPRRLPTQESYGFKLVISHVGVKKLV